MLEKLDMIGILMYNPNVKTIEYYKIRFEKL